MKKPVVAAILNLYPGLGYLYLDASQLVAWVIYYVFTFTAVSIYGAVQSSGVSAGGQPTGFYVWLASLAGLWVVLIIDAYQQARKLEAKQLIKHKSTAIAASRILGTTAVVYS